MALIEVTYAVRVGFEGAYQCLLSDSNTSITGVNNYEITTPSGAAPPPAPAADIINVEESFANEVPVPDGFNFETSDLAQIFSCLSDSLDNGIGSNNYFSSFSSVDLLPISQIIPVLTFKISPQINILSLQYSLEPIITEIDVTTRSKIFVYKNYLSAGSGLFTLTGQTATLGLKITFIAETGSITLGDGNTVVRATNPRLTAEQGYLFINDPGNPLDPGIYPVYVSDFSTGNGLTSNLIDSVNGFTDYSISYFYTYTFSPDVLGLDDPDGTYYAMNSATGLYREKINIGDDTYANHVAEVGIQNVRNVYADWGIEFFMSQIGAGTETIYCVLNVTDRDASPTDFPGQHVQFYEPEPTYPWNEYPILLIADGQMAISGKPAINGTPPTLTPDWYHPTPITTGVWYHIVLESYKGKLNVAVNGVWGTEPPPAPTVRWHQMFIGTHRFDTVASYNHFAGRMYDVNYYFGSRYKHQDFTRPTLSSPLRYGYGPGYQLFATKLSKYFEFSAATGAIQFTGRYLDTNAVNGGTSTTNHTTILDGGNSTSNNPALEWINFLYDRTFFALTGALTLDPQDDFSSISDPIIYPVTPLHIVTNANSLVDISGFGHTVNILGSVTRSTVSQYTGGTSVEFVQLSTSAPSYLEIDPAPWVANYGSVYTIDFWLRANTLNRVAEIISFVNTDHIYDEVYTGSNGENQWSLRFQSKYPELVGISVVNPWANLNGQFTGLAWCELPYSVDDTTYYTNHTFHTDLNAEAGSWLPNTNTWYHVSVVRDGSDTVFKDYLYVNGTLTGYAYRDKVNDISNQKIVIGRGLDGYIQDFRIIKGHRYRTANFTPDTSSVPTQGIGDSYYSKTAAIASWNNLQNPPYGSSLDETINLIGNFYSGYSATNVWYKSNPLAGSFTHDYVNFPSITYANSSIYMDSSAAPSIAVNQIGPSVERAHPRDRDFCIEGWMYFHELPTSYAQSDRSTRVCFFACGTTGTGATHTTETFINAGYDPVAGNVSLRYGTSTYSSLTEVTAAYALSATTWYHVAVIRSGNNLQLCIDGVAVATAVINTLSFPDTTAGSYPIVWQVGRWFYNSLSETQPVGYLFESTLMSLHEVRYTIDTSRYTAPFTPPTRTFIPGPGSGAQL